MRLTSIIEKNFWAFLYGGLAIALIFPGLGAHIQNWIMPLLMLIMFFTLLKINLLDVLSHIKKPGLLSYLTLTYLIILPIIFYYTLLPFDATLAVGTMLLVAMPPGFGSPTLTNIFKGNSSLNLATVIICSLLAPFTIPGLFSLITAQELSIDTWGLFRSLIFIIFIPLIASQFSKKLFSQSVKKITPAISSINIIIFALFGYIIIAGQRDYIFDNFHSLLFQIIFIFILFALLHLIGYFIAFWRPKADRIAISSGNTYMNNGVAIVLATQFFSPEIAILMVLSDLPWNLMPPLFELCSRKLIHRN